MRTHSINRNKKGSSSIMVMMIMLVLVVFGVLALMSSYSDFKLAKKSASWHAAYYKLDAMGEDFVSKVDMQLKKAAADSSNQSGFIASAKSKLDKLSGYKIRLADKDGNLLISTVIEGEDGKKLGVSLQSEKFLQYRLSSTPLAYQKLYEIIEWKELPKEFKYEGQNDLWNGEVNNR